MKLKLTVDNMSSVSWWVGTSYNVHWGSRRKNRDMMSLVKEDIFVNSKKPKQHVNRSTEVKLVATHDQISDIMHSLYFIEP